MADHGLCAYLLVRNDGGGSFTWRLDCGWSEKRAKIPDFTVEGGWVYRHYAGARAAALRRAGELGIRILDEQP